MKTIPVAVQLFTLCEENETDFAGTLKKAAELGTGGVNIEAVLEAAEQTNVERRVVEQDTV